MKLPKLSQLKRRPLGERGMAHFAAPLFVVLLVGLVGTYMLVASHAATHKPPAGTNSNTGVLVLFSQDGAYNRAQISLEGVAPKGYKCDKALTSVNIVGETNKVFVKIGQPTAKKAGYSAFACTPTAGSAQYRVQFGNNIDPVTLKVTNKETPSHSPQLTLPGVVADIDAGYCTFVHADGATRKVPNNLNSCNGSYNPEDPPRPLDVSLRSLPALSTNKKKLGGFADVGATGKDLARHKCSGTVHVVTSSTNAKTKLAAYDLSLKYTKDSHYNDGNAYCVVKLKNVTIPNRGSDQTITVTVTLPKTTNLNPAGPVSATINAPGIPHISRNLVR